jgi:hypothetical protein
MAASYGMSVEDWVAAQEKKVEKHLSTYPEIDVPPLPPKRRLTQPRFKLVYENRDDLWSRIGNSFIWVGSSVFFVEDVYEHKHEFWLILSDGKGKRYKAAYNANTSIDLRSPEPQYINLDSGPAFITRKPDRQFIQGMSRGNIYIKSIGKSRFNRLDDMYELIPGLSDTESLMWQPNYLDLMLKTRALRTLRLSQSIAFYRNKENQLYAEYRGRPLGVVNDDCVELDERDYVRPWIKQDLHEIGCTAKRGDNATPQVEISDN